MTKLLVNLPEPLPLSGLDIAFAGFLQATQASADPNHSLLAALASHQYSRGHACLDLDQLKTDAANLLGWDADKAALLPSHLADAVGSMTWAAGDSSPLVLDGQRLYLRRNWQAEKNIRQSIQARLSLPLEPVAGMDRMLDLLFPENALTPTPDLQKKACEVAALSSFTLITGGPGTGKTTTVAKLLALLCWNANQQGKKLRIALAAPTGKAAARLNESIESAIASLPENLRAIPFEKAVTLHKLLKTGYGYGNGNEYGNGSVRNQAELELLAFDLVIVDEASMIDLEMMNRLTSSLPLTTRLVLLGDRDQLASVEAGSVLAQLCDSVQQTVKLLHSHRFDASSVIGQMAKAVNEGNASRLNQMWDEAPAWSPLSGESFQKLQPERPDDPQFRTLIQHSWQQWLQELQSIKSGFVDDQLALRLIRLFSQFQVLCAVREGRWGVDYLNRLIAKSLGFPAEGWYAGRPVMVNRNDYTLGLMNGDVGMCLPHSDGLKVAFTEGQDAVRWVSPARLEGVQSVFAMTVHKSQGSEFDHVCLVLPYNPVAVLTRELLYTGITRAKKRISLVASNPDVLKFSVERKVLRSGGLVF